MLFFIVILLLLNLGLLLHINSKIPKRDLIAEALKRDKLRRIEEEKNQSSKRLIILSYAKLNGYYTSIKTFYRLLRQPVFITR
ncbi:MAG: hypothetical protein K0Q73_8094 [Paenibacillus sp.]|jgi:hypothetical protein|nr:hypothetical protein [Paenibacillus sp.]